MNERQIAPPPAAISLKDILYVLFRHKRKILIICALGIVAACVVPFFKVAPYQSEARLYIRYVLESKTPSQGAENDNRIKSPDSRGDTIINNELQILTSMDLARKVAESVGPEKILTGLGDRTNLVKAAAVIQSGLFPDVPRNSSVIRLLFKHSDPTIVQLVLQKVIQEYFTKHAEIHAVGAFDEFLQKETDTIRSRLAHTEEELQKAKSKVGIISLADSKRVYIEQISRIESELLNAEAELAGRQAGAKELFKLVRPENVALSTNALDSSTSNSVATAPPEKTAEYRRICGVLDNLNRREQELMVQFTPESALVKAVHDQIASCQKTKQELETEYPDLVAVVIRSNDSAGTDPSVNLRAQMVSQTALATSLDSKIAKLIQQLDKIRKQANAVNDAEPSINELQRKRDLEESHFKHFSESLDQSRLDGQLGAGKVSNISTIQSPTPPFVEKTKILKLVFGILFGSFASAIALAFFIEFYLDQSLRRPSDVQTRLGLPLFMAIPQLDFNGHSQLLNSSAKSLLSESNGNGQDLNGAAQAGDALTRSGNSAQVPSWDPHHPLRPFHEALRDRLINLFELKNMTHHPKLVAITSCAEGAGVSSVASGLAASLSETGDGKVLLVDMSGQDAAARHFHRGDLQMGIDSALESEKRKDALVQDQLYVVREAETNQNLTSNLPKRFKSLVPRLKASDYDYIIFDMPPVSQISLTPRLSKFMDMVLLVVESEKTDRDVVRKATSLLVESKTNVGVVLNKGRNYGPKNLALDV